MAVAIDTSRDGKLVEDVEQITFVHKTAEKPGAGVQVNNCKRFPVKKERLTTDSILAKAEIFWHIWRVDLAAAGITDEPHQDDQVLDKDGKRWICFFVDVLSRSLGVPNRFRLVCKKDPRTP